MFKQAVKLFAVTALLVSVLAPAAHAQIGPLGAPELTLRFDTVQFVNSISEDPVIIGTLECSAAAENVAVYVEVTQNQEPRDTYADGRTSVDCDDTVRWMIVTGYGEFEGGPVAVEGTAVYDSNNDYEPEAETDRSDTASLIGCTRIGSLKDDTLKGKDKRDRLCGLDGDDTLIGAGEGDLLRAGPGNDVLKGGRARDILLGGEGEDSIWGGAGNDTLSGDQQNDYMHGGTGKDKCVGGPGRDRQRSC